MIIQIPKETYNMLSEAEKKVLRFLSENEADILSMSITNIARKSFTSISTVSRTIKKCGYDSISELRYFIQNHNTVLEPTYLTNDIFAKSYRECIMTLDNIKEASILTCADYLQTADKIVVYARGGTALIAEEFKMELQFLGYNVHVVSDVTWMLKTDKLITSKDTVFILSVQCSDAELVTAAKMAKKVNANLIVCGCQENILLKKYADVFLVGHSEYILNNTTMKIKSRMPLTILCRTIVEYLIANENRNN